MLGCFTAGLHLSEGGLSGHGMHEFSQVLQVLLSDIIIEQHHSLFVLTCKVTAMTGHTNFLNT